MRGSRTGVTVGLACFTAVAVAVVLRHVVPAGDAPGGHLAQHSAPMKTEASAVKVGAHEDGVTGRMHKGGGLGTKALGQMTNTAMQASCEAFLARVSDFQAELDSLQADVRSGKLKTEVVHGICLAVVTNDAVMQVVDYYSVTGGVRSYTKRVHQNAGQSQEINSMGYELNFSEGGSMVSVKRRDGAEGVRFFPNGTLKEYYLLKLVGGEYKGEQYVAEWDSTMRLVREGMSHNRVD
jgi:hypothetical protein